MMKMMFGFEAAWTAPPPIERNAISPMPAKSKLATVLLKRCMAALPRADKLFPHKS
jgi:hypothetical protein